jgi:hypothetical protein
MPKRERTRVMHGNLSKTNGGLSKDNLKYNKNGRIVSKNKSKPIKGKLGVNEFYCVSCRKRVGGDNIYKEKAKKTGQPMLRAQCAVCGKNMCKFVKA